MRIYGATSVDPLLSGYCERALADEAFQSEGMMPDGSFIISFLADERAWAAVIGVEKTARQDDAMLISAVYPVGSEGLAALVADLKTG
ncbi:MAG TPA: hypothetical protein VNW15_14520 [Rhizomicrobium sp.]|jgi:hypothetical protein|nr:hypothetical protein [Rhizomicrobium sp.]